MKRQPMSSCQSFLYGLIQKSSHKTAIRHNVLNIVIFRKSVTFSQKLRNFRIESR